LSDDLLAAFLTVASAIALTTLATLILVFASSAQLRAVRTAITTLFAVTPAVAHAFFAANVLILAGATQTITAIVLNLLHSRLVVGNQNIPTYGCRNARCHAHSANTDCKSNRTDDLSHVLTSLAPPSSKLSD
jgi:hypothetical protein